MPHARKLGRLLLVLLVAAAPRSAAAQLGIEGVVGQINDVTLFYSCWSTTGEVRSTNGCSPRNGYGVEVSYRIGEIGLFGKYPKNARYDTTTITIKRQPGAAVESTTTVNYTKPTPKAYHHYLMLELALGYSQYTGFKATDPILDLRGTVREIPAVALYASYTDDDDAHGWFLERFSPYVGIRSGLVQLNNAQVLYPAANTDLVNVSAATSTAFQVGAAGGISFSIDKGGRLMPFIETSYNVRKFPSVQWTATNGMIPARLPRELDFSGWALSAGMQIKVRDPKP